MTPIEIALVVVGSGAVAFVVTEFATRAWMKHFGKAHVWAPYARVKMLLDRETLPTLEPVVEHHTNPDGERGDVAPSDASRLFRVLVVGGSAAECWFLDQKSSWPNVMQTELSTPENLGKLGAKAVHVGNIGRSLVTTRHVDAILERVLPRYAKLDAIVFMIGVSDLILWLESGAPEHLVENRIASSALFTQHPDGPFGWGPKTLALRRVASYWNRRLRQPTYVRERVGKRLTDARRMRSNAKEIIRETPDSTEMLERLEFWFEKLIARAQKKASYVLVVHQPWIERDFTPDEEKLLWSFGTGRPYAGEVTRYYSHDVAWKLHRLVHDRVAKVATRAGVAQLDVMKIVPADFEHYYDDHHHTPKGCRVIGEAVARTLADVVSTPAQR
ncbi:MAG: hypothetical protein SGI72_14270 [Planctomycetota bacterium]|nr:hypothetical protein [Planctomycetota bacterium]